MTHAPATRRRFIRILAASGAALAAGPLAAAVRSEPVTWSGIALGADAQMQLLHPDRAHAEKLVALAVAEVHRLEKIFSLYQDDSALVQLNRSGRLDRPAADMARLISEALQFSRATDGCFDVSVQPLWQLYARQLQAGKPLPPAPRDLQRALASVGWQHVLVDEQAIALARPGMALTLNGIAQGYITDRVTELLRANGLEHALVDLGETRAIGRPEHRDAWLAGIADPANRAQLLGKVALRDQALATSGGYGTPLTADGSATHLFDPRSGLARPRWASVTVRAANATTADALSTAFSLMDEHAITRVAREYQAQAWLLAHGQGQQLIRIG